MNGTTEHKQIRSIREAAQALGIKDQTLRNWTARGWILYVQMPNGRKAIPVSEIERLSRPIQGGNLW